MTDTSFVEPFGLILPGGADEKVAIFQAPDCLYLKDRRKNEKTINKHPPFAKITLSCRLCEKNQVLFLKKAFSISKYSLRQPESNQKKCKSN